ncbi:MAG: SurA N-terminal domain-containing protein [Alphaproteobacteria bacterium]|nr:SurA N-terminal domain-containing protein [Alphaproteobacteria bacterium]
MLQAIRGKSASIIVKVLLVLLIISFGAWGINDYIGVSFNDRAPVVVDGKEVPFQEIDRPFRDQVNQIRRNIGGDFTLEQGMQLGLLDQVIAEVGTRTALNRFLDEVGLVTSEETMKSALRRAPAFQDENGNFDRARFEGALFQSGLSQEVFLSQLQQDIVQQQLLASVGTGMAAPTPMVHALFKYREEERIADLLELPYESIRDIPEPSDSDLAEHRDAFGGNFQTPEYRNIRLLALTPDTVASEVLITEDDLRATYDNRIDQFTTPETRTVRQIVLPDQATAQTAADRIRGGEGFAEVAVSLAGMEEADTLLGAVSQADLFGETGTAVFQAPIGGVTSPVETAFGWHVFLVEGSTPGNVQPFDTVREALEGDLRRERALDVVFELINDVEEIQAGGGSVTDIAQELNLRSIELRALAPSGALRDGATPAGDNLPLAEIAAVAFATEAGSTSPARQIGEAAYAVVQVLDVIAPEVPPLAEIRDRVAASWRDEQRRLIAAEKAEAIAASAQEGVSVDALAEEHNLTLRNSPPFKRTGEGLVSLPRAIAGTAFTQSKGDVGIAEGQDAVYIVKLTEIRIPNPGDAQDAVADLATEMDGSMRASLQGSIAAAVVGRYPIEVDRATLERLYGERGGN